MKIRSLTQNPYAILDYSPLLDETGAREFTIAFERDSTKNNRLGSSNAPYEFIVRVEGCPDRTSVENLRGLKLFIRQEQLPELETDEYYHSDLIGLQAIDDKGAVFGTVSAVLNFGAGDILDVAPLANVEGGAKEGWLIPFQNTHVGKVDLENKTIAILTPLEAF